MGYFAALYCRVTMAVKEGIAQGRFEDGPRMERLDVVFANRYLAAEESWREGGRPSASWRVAFEAAQSWPPIVLQHLLLGMNAHINLDLGIAAAQVAPGGRLPALRRDFDEINAVLAGLLDEVRSEVEAVSPWIALADRIDPSAEDALVNFSMRVARREAWAFAQRLAPLDAHAQEAAIRARDAEVALLGRLVRRPPGVVPKLLLLLVRSRETAGVDDVIDVLDRRARSVPVAGPPGEVPPPDAGRPPSHAEEVARRGEG